MTKQTHKMISMYKILGLNLIKNGTAFLKRAFHLKVNKTTRTYLRGILLNKQTPLKNVLFADPNYYFVSIEEMRDIIEHDWTDRAQYEKDWNDCDDFAFRFKSHMQERYGVTAVALCKHIELFDTDTGEHLDFHRANVFFADENGIIKLWFLEPQTDRVVEVKNYTEFIKLTGWLNKLNVFDF